MNHTARHLLDCYARDIEPVGGWTFPNALREAQLDYSPASLKRVNLLLDEVRAQLRPQRKAFLDQPGARNFRALLALYLTDYLEKYVGAQAAPQDMSSEARLLAWVDEKLFGESVAPSCAEYVAELFSGMIAAQAQRRVQEARDADFQDTGWDAGPWAQPGTATAARAATCYA